jgi:hypothetical protein
MNEARARALSSIRTLRTTAFGEGTQDTSRIRMDISGRSLGILNGKARNDRGGLEQAFAQGHAVTAFASRGYRTEADA